MSGATDGASARSRLDHPAFPILAIAVSVCLLASIPLLSSGLDHDEVPQLACLAGVAQRGHSMPDPWWLWTFADGSSEEWASILQDVRTGREAWPSALGNPPAKMSFLRVGSAATLRLDHALFGFWLPAYHAQNLIWFLIFLIAAGRLCLGAFSPEARSGPRSGGDGVCGPAWLAAIAVFLLATDANNAEVMGRIATRHLLVASTLALFGLLAHVRWREGRSRYGPLPEIIWFALALASGEGAIQVIAYLPAFEICYRAGPWGRRLAALLPTSLLCLVYLAIYRACGFGARGGGYLDPFHDAGSVVRAAAGRFADLLTEGVLVLRAVTDPSASPWRLVSSAPTSATRVLTGCLILVSGGLLAWLGVRWLETYELKGARWLGAGAVLSILPVIPGQPGPRLLLVPGIGIAAFLSAAAVAAWRAFRHGETRLPVRVLAGTFIIILLLARAVLSPITLERQLGIYATVTRAIDYRWRSPRAVDRMLSEERESGIAGLVPVSPGDRPAVVVVVTAPSISVPRTPFPELRRVIDGGDVLERTGTDTWYYLSNNIVDFEHVLVRTGSDTFELHLGAASRPDPMSRTLWIGRTGSPGGSVETNALTIEVLESGEEREIRRIRVRVHTGLDDPTIWFAAWIDGALRRVHLPPIGHSIELSGRTSGGS